MNGRLDPDQPLPDYGAGWCDRIEIEGPEGVSLPKWLTPTWSPCQDCRANGFLQWRAGWVGVWLLTVAHDDGCPTLARMDTLGGPQ